MSNVVQKSTKYSKKLKPSIGKFSNPLSNLTRFSHKKLLTAPKQTKNHNRNHLFFFYFSLFQHHVVCLFCSITCLIKLTSSMVIEVLIAHKVHRQLIKRRP